MRTTVTLEDDALVTLEKIRTQEGKTFKDALNEVVRLGLHAKMARPAEVERRRTATFDLGRPTISNMDNVAELLAATEGDDYK